ncbi:(2Fe-2S) ferredoxin [Streptomyces griseochromogenes]|uniref:(2Fe-2S) ferredoxin n=1 Tax=Streptomyces griseochromogenes TaxID=68214 RepID=A0ABS4LZQ9_9ACTN|nr:(2Fe-2S) ferredoxin [Streptomyces griseochromogenes]
MRRRKAPAQGEPRCSVTVCRGCCCGTAKIPGVDHATQLNTLKAELSAVARIWAVNCLDTCEQANVIVVQPSSAGRAAGGRPVWLGLVNDPDATADIAQWVRSGGPGLADPPDILDLYEFAPSRRVRRGVEEWADAAAPGRHGCRARGRPKAESAASVRAFEGRGLLSRSVSGRAERQ